MDETARVELMIDRMRAAWISDGSGVEAERQAFHSLSTNFPEPFDVSEKWLDLGGVQTLSTTPTGFNRSTHATVLYFHGGAFLIGSPGIYRYQSSRIAQAVPARVVTVDYRLAPEHPYPAAIDDATRAYEELVSSGVAPARIILAGDSAGGNIALAVALRLRESERRLPAGIVAISPWVDLTCSGASMQTNANPRHLAQRQGLLSSAATYLGDTDPADPLASPLFAELSGLPPTLIQVGAEETLLSEGIELHTCLRASGTPAELTIYEHMVHEWHLLSGLLEPDFPLEGAEQAIGEFAAFVRERTATTFLPANA